MFSKSTLSFNFRALLGNGLKFIPTPRKSMTWSKMRDHTLPRFSRDLQVKCFMAGKEREENFNPKLYVKSRWKPKPWMNPNCLLDRFDNFSKGIRANFHVSTASHNLPLHHRNALDYLRSNKDNIVIRCDKNLGPALIERDKYIRLILRDHLQDTHTYTRLDISEANKIDIGIRARIMSWIKTHSCSLSKHEQKFILAHLESSKQNPFCIFYGMAKVHKTPLKMRPVVSYSGSTCWALGVWIDAKLQVVAQQQASYFRDSFALKEDLSALQLQKNNYIFTEDAVSMYTNIPTAKALKIITNLLISRFSHEIPADAVAQALDIVMNNNVFTFGDMIFKQNTGTAMGAPPAPPWANIFMAISENQFLPHQPNLIFYRRFIDDVIGIWRDDGDNNKWDYFKSKLNNPFFELEWEISEKTKSCIYMDLSIQIEGNTVSTTLYEKPNNLHLFIPFKSCHPPGLLKGMVYGMIHRINKLCSKELDRKRRYSDYYKALLRRGYDKETIMPIFHLAINGNRNIEKVPRKSRVFFHVKYHPKNMKPSTIQRLWKQTIATPPGETELSNLRNYFGRPTEISTLVVAHSRSPNLGNLLSYRKLKDDDGPLASSYMD